MREVKPFALESVLADVLEDAANEMNTLARLVLQHSESAQASRRRTLRWLTSQKVQVTAQTGSGQAQAFLWWLGSSMSIARAPRMQAS